MGRGYDEGEYLLGDVGLVEEEQLAEDGGHPAEEEDEEREVGCGLAGDEEH